MDEQGQVLHVKLPVDTKFARTLRLVTSSVAATMDFTLEEVEDLKIALEEAYLMAVGRFDGPDELDFAFHILDDRLEVRVGPLRAMTPEVDRQEVEETYGLMILRAVVDEAEFTELDGASQLVMVKGRGR